MSAEGQRGRALVVMALLSLIWGYSWVVAKIALGHAGPFQFAFLRIVIAVAALGAWLVLTGRPVKLTHPREAMLIGSLQTAGFMLVNTWALVDGGPGKTSILVFTMPVWVLLMGWPALGERVRGLQWVAVGLALLGLLFIMEPWRVQTTLLSKCLAVAAGMLWATGVILAKRLHNRVPVDVMSFTLWQMAIGLVPTALVAWLVPAPAIDWSATFVVALLFSGIVATGMGWIMWLYVLHRLPAGTTSLSSLAVPVIAAASSALQLGERLRPVELGGMIAIGTALALVSWETARRRQVVDPAMGQD